MKVRQGKTRTPTKHSQKSVGSSRKRNMKRMANKVIRQIGKQLIKEKV
jgi:hypothetical protein